MEKKSPLHYFFRSLASLVTQKAVSSTELKSLKKENEASKIYFQTIENQLDKKRRSDEF